MDRWLNFRMGTGQTEGKELYVSSALFFFICLEICNLIVTYLLLFFSELNEEKKNTFFN